MKLNSYLVKNRLGTYYLRIQRGGIERRISLRTKDFSRAALHAYAFGAKLAAMKNPISTFELKYDGKNIELKTQDNDADRAAGSAALLAILKSKSPEAASPSLLKKIALRDAVAEYETSLLQDLNKKKFDKKSFNMRVKSLNDLIDLLGADFDVSQINTIVIEDLYIEPRLEVVARATIKRELSTIFAFIDYCANERRMYIKTAFKVPFLADNVSYESFTKRELVSLFSKMPDIAVEPFKFWIPVIGLFTGARVGEIAGMTVGGIYKQGELDCYFLPGTKTDAAPRHLPIHSTILSLGFLDYVKMRADAGFEMLFDLPKSEQNGWGAKPSKFFTKFKRDAGIDSPLKVFHSFRHTLVDVLKQSLVNEEARKEYVGHSTGEDVHQTIYSKNPLRMQTIYSEVVTKIDFNTYFQYEDGFELNLPALKSCADRLLEVEIIRAGVK
jgi:integrase